LEISFLELTSVAAKWGLAFSQEQFHQIENYLEFLLDYNRKVNLTAETDFKTLLLRHIARRPRGGSSIKGTT